MYLKSYNNINNNTKLKMSVLVNDNTSQNVITLVDDTIFLDAGPDSEIKLTKTIQSTNAHIFNIMSTVSAEDKLINDKMENLIMEKDGKIGVVINESYGGFSISDNAINELNARGFRISKMKFGHKRIKRTCKELIKLIEEGIDVNGEYAHLGVEYIDKKYFDGPGFWNISEYDGKENIDIDDIRYEIWHGLRSLVQFHNNIKHILNQSTDPVTLLDTIKLIYEDKSEILTNCAKLI